MRAKEAQMSSEGAVKALRSLDAKDPEAAHGRADTILLLSVPPSVRQAYLDLAAKCEWWVTA